MDIHIIQAICLGIVLLLVLFLVYFLILLPIHRKLDWKQEEKYKYFQILRDRDLHLIHYDKMKDWLHSTGQEIYIKSPKLVREAFYIALERTEIKTIKELKEKFLNEYKSRNSENTPAV